MTLETPRPRVCERWLAEKRELVVADAARQAGRVEHAENLLELHNLHHFQVATGAEQRREKLMREPPLGGRHEIERHTDALRGPVGPVLARLVVEVERQIFPLVEAQQRLGSTGATGYGGEQGARRSYHILRGRDAARLLRESGRRG